jgi:hypothetical protein
MDQSTLLTTNAFGTVALDVPPFRFVSWFPFMTWMKCQTVFVGVQLLPSCRQAGNGPRLVATTYAKSRLFVLLLSDDVANASVAAARSATTVATLANRSRLNLARTCLMDILPSLA